MLIIRIRTSEQDLINKSGSVNSEWNNKILDVFSQPFKMFSRDGCDEQGAAVNKMMFVPVTEPPSQLLS